MAFGDNKPAYDYESIRRARNDLLYGFMYDLLKEKKMYVPEFEELVRSAVDNTNRYRKPSTPEVTGDIIIERLFEKLLSKQTEIDVNDAPRQELIQSRLHRLAQYTEAVNYGPAFSNEPFYQEALEGKMLESTRRSVTYQSDDVDPAKDLEKITNAIEAGNAAGVKGLIKLAAGRQNTVSLFSFTYGKNGSQEKTIIDATLDADSLTAKEKKEILGVMKESGAKLSWAQQQRENNDLKPKRGGFVDMVANTGRSWGLWK